MTDAGNEPRVTQMSGDDIDAVVRLQLETLSDSLVTQLGERFLRRFHEAALIDPSAIGLVARMSGEQVAGFALGTTDGSRSRNRLRSRTLTALLRAVASRPALFPRFALGLLQKEPSSPMVAELLLLAVGPEYRRLHVATSLLSAFDGRLHVAGVPGYRVAVRSWLKPAIEFYRSQGFELEAEAKVLGASMTYLRRRLPARE